MGVSRVAVQTETLPRASFWCFRIFLVSKKMGIREGSLSRYSIAFDLSHSTKHCCSGNFLCFGNFCLRKKFWISGRRVTKSSLGIVPSHISKTILREGLLCFTKFLASKNVWIETAGACHDSSSPIHETLRLTLQESFLGDVFWFFKKNSDLEKFNFTMKRSAERLSPLSFIFFVSECQNKS